MSIEDPWRSTNTEPSRREQQQTEAYKQELIATYPTPESIVDDFRHDKISQLAMPLRFPDANDQASIRKMAEERNTQDKEEGEQTQADFREKYVKPILDAAYSLDRDTVASIVGSDAWEINEFEAKLEVSLNNETDTERAIKMLQVLTEIKEAEGANDAGSREKIEQLAKQFNSL